MEFKCLTNIETSFRQLRMYALVFAGVCAVVTVAAVWMSYSFAERQRQKIYVLDNGRSLMVALSQDLAQNRPVEAREHVRRFHELFFTLSPDKAAIESNVGRALQMADKSALSYYKVLQEKGFFNRLIAGQRFADGQSGQHPLQFRPLSLRGYDLCPAAYSAREHRHGAVARHDMPSGERLPLGQQPAGLYGRGAEHRRKQRPRDL